MKLWDISLRRALDRLIKKDRLGLLVLSGLFFFPACSQHDHSQVDRLNNRSYACHYRNLDSAWAYACKACALAESHSDAKAEALNNMAFVCLMRMDYAKADSLLNEVPLHTDNQIELLVADVQQMRLCQRESRNKDYYDHRELAEARLHRIGEERDRLSQHWLGRLAYAETEYAIVSSTYYYYVGLEQESRASLLAIDPHGEILQDTAQYLNYLYNVGAGGILRGKSPDEVSNDELAYLSHCLSIARSGGYVFFEANALEAIAEKGAVDTAVCFPATVPVCTGKLHARKSQPEPTAILAARKALSLFRQYGDVYQLAGAWRTLATCQMSEGDYVSALASLDSALADGRINQAPDLVASICEQLCVAYSALDRKPDSDAYRNRYLDLQEQTRQDRYLEARASRLEASSSQLNVMLAAVAVSIVALVFMLWLFHFLHRRRNRRYPIDLLLQPLEQWREQAARRFAESQEREERLAEEQAVCRSKVEAGEYRNLEQRAKLSLAISVVPLIDRMLNEVELLATRKEAQPVREQRLDYIAQLAQNINERNDTLTQWIKLRQGQLTLRVGSFRLQQLFDIVARGRMAFSFRGVRFDVQPTEAVVKADRVLTLFMLNTLADNARKFTPRGGLVTLSARTADDYVEISVSDTGPGFSSQKSASGHGFGLANCRGIIEKYKKTSKLFSVCLFGVDSKPGKGSRVYFRLPPGVVRTVLVAGLLLGIHTNGAARSATPLPPLADSHSKAKAFADSAYFSNIDGTFARTLAFADSCLLYLNSHYRAIRPGGRRLMTLAAGHATPAAEIEWYRDSLPADYHTILDIRNETAVAALALHQWQLYDDNNTAYTRLYKEMSADHTLPAYCRMMQQSETDKTVAVILLLLLLLSIVPAYYILYYRHRLYYRFCVDKVKGVCDTLASNLPTEEKRDRVASLGQENFPKELRRVVDTVIRALDEEIERRRSQTVNMELATDQLRKTEQEAAALHVANSVLDNSLSSLKHETMYYPSRILSLVHGDVEELRQTVRYYRELYAIFIRQCVRQQELCHISVTVVNVADVAPAARAAEAGLQLLGNRLLLVRLFALLRAQAGGDCGVSVAVKGADYLLFDVSAPAFKAFSPTAFTEPAAEQIPYVLCRQIVRDHSELTHRRGCGISAEVAPDRLLHIRVILPRARAARPQTLHDSQ